MQFYLGTLTRYYTGVQPLEGADPEVVARAVSAWRHWLNKELPHPLDWNESPTAPFDEAVVGETCMGALVLCCLYPSTKAAPREQAVPENWRNDPRLRNAVALGFEAMPFAMIYGPNLWLPGDFDFIAEATGLNEETLRIGSSSRLMHDLEQIRESIPGATGMERSALEAWQKMYDLARRSVAFRLPLCLFKA